MRISSGVLIILHESGQDYGSDLGTSTLTILEVGVFILIFASMEWLYLLFGIQFSATLDEQADTWQQQF